jgi:hypothetical protein
VEIFLKSILLITKSIKEPVADWPPSFSHIPGIMAPKYGPQTPGINLGDKDTAI